MNGFPWESWVEASGATLHAVLTEFPPPAVPSIPRARVVLCEPEEETEDQRGDMHDCNAMIG